MGEVGSGGLIVVPRLYIFLIPIEAEVVELEILISDKYGTKTEF